MLDLTLDVRRVPHVLVCRTLRTGERLANAAQVNGVERARRYRHLFPPANLDLPDRNRLPVGLMIGKFPLRAYLQRPAIPTSVVERSAFVGERRAVEVERVSDGAVCASRGVPIVTAEVRVVAVGLAILDRDSAFVRERPTAIRRGAAKFDSATCRPASRRDARGLGLGQRRCTRRPATPCRRSGTSLRPSQPYRECREVPLTGTIAFVLWFVVLARRSDPARS